MLRLATTFQHFVAENGNFHPFSKGCVDWTQKGLKKSRKLMDVSKWSIGTLPDIVRAGEQPWRRIVAFVAPNQK
jgi:hypothetical protein